MSNYTYIAKSYAKINLGLRITERLPNGYHTLQTGFVFINWYDKLQVTRSHETLFRCSNKDLSTGEDNLIMKAVKRMSREVGQSLNYHIQLSKMIPMGAGLGGGSSNAAQMLHMINEIEQLGYTNDDLAEIGLELGADVPIFVHGKTAMAQGIGEKLTFTNIQPDMHIVTVYPGFESSTAEAYTYCQPYQDEALNVDKVLTEYPVDDWSTFLVNDLEPPVIQIHPFVGLLKDQFYEMGAIYAAMSGSGSSVFGLYNHEFAAIEAFEYLKQEGYQANLTTPLFSPDNRIIRKS
ncbi:MAG: 4-(cytidine 5'-diphospho)-2-C-methyl-D-erythritol kinase [Balneolales bacterium]|nr:4-(cytidine 5'-diphospho)-2-C-methyl-D-erythritol kinase [Balneolales bacterium]